MSLPGYAVVIGAGSGIGRAAAELFVERGCKAIAIGDINTKGLEETASNILRSFPEAKVIQLHCDVTSETSVEDIISTAANEFGRIDYACNCAGILMGGASPDFATQDFDKLFSINVRGMWLCQRAQIRQMLKQEAIGQCPSRGAIANVSSMAALRTYAGLSSYCATKQAILGFSKSDGLLYGKDHIRINAVCPGVIDTPFLKPIGGSQSEIVQGALKRVSMGRVGQPREIAEALLWLVSERASFVNGTELAVNGGEA